MADQPDRSQAMAEFVGMTGATPEQAVQYLQAHNWDHALAVQSFYGDEEERVSGDTQAPEVDSSYSGPRTLDGRPAPQAAAAAGSSSSASRPVRRKGIATLGSLGGHSHHDDHEDHDDASTDDDEDDHGRGNLFAGGEKSGLAVQDPSQEGNRAKKIIGDIVAKAKANAMSGGAPEHEAGSSRTAFRGTGMTLGGEGTESRAIPDPLGPSEHSSGEVQERVLHIWQDGFSIGDGELRRFDDPENARDLEIIRQGRAPLHLMDVQLGAPVDVKLDKHDMPYVAPPKKYKPFEGSGRRLGSPVPGDGSTASLSEVITQSAPAGSSAASTQSTIDSSQPTLMIRIQLPDGTRLPARFNTTHTLGDVYGFVEAASPETRTRQWVLATTFPNKEHSDKSLVLGDMAEFKKGGTAVVKWV